MSSLDLFAGEAFFKVQVEADQGENDGDRLGGIVGVLGGVCIIDKLMDEFQGRDAQSCYMARSSL